MNPRTLPSTQGAGALRLCRGCCFHSFLPSFIQPMFMEYRFRPSTALGTMMREQAWPGLSQNLLLSGGDRYESANFVSV